ncbi:Rossmann-like and DUF2520 domain-containing protein [Thermasporomyces composti]|uniref:Putative short-subunit dehydrogenase-like oxidoreductase (DUF2520 family) n=1 Tax=Thermasporomyces composti TaxID=696763 RepID=A0A3D9V0K9_THECX|nr:DUF2520 domain-containing protein [Thermasporomyces composti]REF35288.1 putative short-subunit dehydrogenase-like oxidoreductase (DUF2520 family) [Thermasporomyces composti]
MRELERNQGAPALTGAPPDSRRLVVVGHGRVGGSLARAARAAGLDVTVVHHGDAQRATAGADVVLLCVPDRAIADVCGRVVQATPPPRFLGHVSGASSLDVLDQARQDGIETFSLHPLQTIPHPRTDLTDVPCAVAGSTPEARSAATRLGIDLGMRPFEVPDDRRAAYHAAAAIASNFLVTLAETATDLLARAGVEDARAILGPLVARTAANWAEAGADALTGPIARGDESTVRRHLAALTELAPELLPLYQVLAERTRTVAASATRSRTGGSPFAPGTEPDGRPTAWRDEWSPTHP